MVSLVLVSLISLGPGCARPGGPGARKPDVAKEIVIGAGLTLLAAGVVGVVLLHEISPVGGSGYVDFADRCRDGCH